MKTSQLWLIAGPNGAGKSSLAKSAVFGALTVPKALNPDDFAFGLLRRDGHTGFADAPFEVQRTRFLQAANWVYEEVVATLKRGGSVAVETVLSTEKYLPLFEQAARDGDAFLIYIGNQKPEISIERVAFRVQKGGHDVPQEKIRQRWQRSLDLMPVFLEIATQGWVFDNSSFDSPPSLVALKTKGEVHLAPATRDAPDVLAHAIQAHAALKCRYDLQDSGSLQTHGKTAL